MNQPYDPDFSHAMLVAVLAKLGGSIDLDPADFRPDTMGNAAGEVHHVAMERLANGRLRLSVLHRPLSQKSR